MCYSSGSQDLFLGRSTGTYIRQIQRSQGRIPGRKGVHPGLSKTCLHRHAQRKQYEEHAKRGGYHQTIPYQPFLSLEIVHSDFVQVLFSI